MAIAGRWMVSALGNLAEKPKEQGEKDGWRKPRFLCLHGFRTSGEIMRQQLARQWPEKVTSRLDLVFPDGPCPASGDSDVERLFPPPYYEWFQYDEEYIKLTNFDECVTHVENFMMKHGPFDGLIGFSQGAALSVTLMGMQAKGVAMMDMPMIKCAIIISGVKFKSPILATKGYSTKITCPSIHFLGDKDYVREHGEHLLELFVDPIVIRHSKGHIIPKLDANSEDKMMKFIDKIKKDLADAPHESSVVNIGLKLGVPKLLAARPPAPTFSDSLSTMIHFNNARESSKP